MDASLPNDLSVEIRIYDTANPRDFVSSVFAIEQDMYESNLEKFLAECRVLFEQANARWTINLP